MYIYFVIDFKDREYDLEARFFSIRMNLLEKLCKKNPLKDRWTVYLGERKVSFV